MKDNMTPFKELAERIEEDPHGWWFCCIDLPEKPSDFFSNFFEPTQEEKSEYHVLYTSWMGHESTTVQQDNLDRITALLFADQLWQDKENRKYERI